MAARRRRSVQSAWASRRRFSSRSPSSSSCSRRRRPTSRQRPTHQPSRGALEPTRAPHTRRKRMRPRRKRTRRLSRRKPPPSLACLPLPPSPPRPSGSSLRHQRRQMKKPHQLACSRVQRSERRDTNNRMRKQTSLKAKVLLAPHQPHRLLRRLLPLPLQLTTRWSTSTLRLSLLR